MKDTGFKWVGGFEQKFEVIENCRLNYFSKVENSSHNSFFATFARSANILNVSHLLHNEPFMKLL